MEGKDKYDAISIAIEASEQEHCKDCISRADVRHLIAEVNIKTLGCISTKTFKTLYNGVDELPPVTPQPKTGHWIDDKCSVCGKGTEDLISSSEWYRNEEPNFCPFCGAKMAESEE